MSIGRAKAFFTEKKLSVSLEDKTVIRKKPLLKNCIFGGSFDERFRARPLLKDLLKQKSVSYDSGKQLTFPITRYVGLCGQSCVVLALNDVYVNRYMLRMLLT